MNFVYIYMLQQNVRRSKLSNALYRNFNSAKLSLTLICYVKHETWSYRVYRLVIEPRQLRVIFFQKML